MSKRVKRTTEAKRSPKMTDPTTTEHQMMTDLSERALVSMAGVLAEKQKGRDSTKGKLDKLKELDESEIEDETEHNNNEQQVEIALMTCNSELLTNQWLAC